MGDLGLAQVGDVGVTVDGQPAGRSWPVKAWGMEGEHRRVDDIPFFGNYHSLAFDGIADLSSHNEPEFRALRMIMPLVLRIEWTKVLLISVNDIRYRPVVVDESSACIIRRLRQFIQIDVRLVAVLVGARLPTERYENPLRTRKFGRLHLLRIERLGFGNIDFES